MWWLLSFLPWPLVRRWKNVEAWKIDRYLDRKARESDDYRILRARMRRGKP